MFALSAHEVELDCYTLNLGWNGGLRSLEVHAKHGTQKTECPLDFASPHSDFRRGVFQHHRYMSYPVLISPLIAAHL